jgi:hypothetical protein
MRLEALDSDMHSWLDSRLLCQRSTRPRLRAIPRLIPPPLIGLFLALVARPTLLALSCSSDGYPRIKADPYDPATEDHGRRAGRGIGSSGGVGRRAKSLRWKREPAAI